MKTERLFGQPVKGGKVMNKLSRNSFSLALLSMALLLMPSFGFSAQASQDQPQMFLQTRSPESFPKTVKSFREVVAEAGWSILNTTNMAGVLSAKGHTLSPILIFDVCSG